MCVQQIPGNHNGPIRGSITHSDMECQHTELPECRQPMGPTSHGAHEAQGYHGAHGAHGGPMGTWTRHGPLDPPVLISHRSSGRINTSEPKKCPKVCSVFPSETICRGFYTPKDPQKVHEWRFAGTSFLMCPCSAGGAQNNAIGN